MKYSSVYSLKILICKKKPGDVDSYKGEYSQFQVLIPIVLKIQRLNMHGFCDVVFLEYSVFYFGGDTMVVENA